MKYVLIAMLLFTGCATVRPWTTEEKVLLAASCLAVAADMTTTIDGLNNGNWETNPMMGEYPSDSQVVLTMAATHAVFIIVAHYWSDFRTWILGIKTGVNAGFAFHNMRTAKD